MPLKVTGRTPTRMRVTESSQAPSAAREIAMQCGSCGKRCYAMLPHAPTPEERMAMMRAAMEEHRRVCPVGAPEDGRTYRIFYPRA